VAKTPRPLTERNVPFDWVVGNNDLPLIYDLAASSIVSEQ